MGSSNRRGYIMILLTLITMAIGLILAVIQLRAYQGEPQEDIEGISVRPWDQWKDLSKRADDGNLNNSAIKFEESLIIDTTAMEGTDPRGDLKIFLSPAGEVTAIWSGNYYPENQLEFLIMKGASNGFFDSEQVFIDDNGNEDPLKLNFLTKGAFNILSTNYADSKVKSLSGNLYITGWVETDKKANGKIIITSGPKEYRSYDWSGHCQKNKNPFKF